VSVAKCCVGKEKASLFADPLGKFFGAEFDEFLARAGRGILGFGVFGNDWLGEFFFGIDFSFHIRASVDDDIR